MKDLINWVRSELARESHHKLGKTMDWKMIKFLQRLLSKLLKLKEDDS